MIVADTLDNAGGRNAALGLKAFLDSVEAAVRRVPAAWVKCELHALKVTERFVRMEFLELDASGGQVARAQGGCGPRVWQRIKQTFDEAGLPLEAGSQVLVKLEPRMSATFGFQVAAVDIDLTFALGDLTARIARIRQHLTQAGCWASNRRLVKPADFVRIAVIAPANAAGLGDFRATADRLEGAGLARFAYHAAPFQTREAPARIVEILRGLFRECRTEATRSCAVAIIRGGGASADLAWLVDEKLAEAVCRMNVPVMTGIGHERDRNLLDEIACLPFDTPSKVAEHIRATVTQAAITAHRAYEVICANAGSALDGAQADLRETRYRSDHLASERVRIAEVTVRNAATGLEPGARRLLDETQNAAGTAVEATRAGARQRREAAADAVQTLGRTVATAVEASLRPLELGTARARGEIATRADAVPAAARDDVERLALDIRRDAAEATEIGRTRLSALSEQLTSDVRRTLDETTNAIALVRARADALHPRTVLAAGYALLRDPAGKPITGTAVLRRAERIVAELRDGDAVLKPVLDHLPSGGDDDV